ncbi:UDP-N-acetyl-D-mannosamine dehydrogenase [Lentibacillus kapialis]|uniref:UDP-N-acetyl-D-mannosamine dehydrogenase n=1 Tax=Lentibacillus kapialis TaxID=340214 RepID=A0A917Q1M0_9BACI|nr:nucleotide sugar dehydrogenase [Lentibacillus kapialis]GGK04657.1 UDP-N-acetyl-D-mannosamine dehydrogenase [Lentibacillus kapialis]
MRKQLCVIGLGYIGLPTAAVFADNGFDVTGVDVNETLVNQLNDGQLKTREKGLDMLLARLAEEGKITASASPVEADIYIIAVPTPHNADHTANLDYVSQAAKSILPVLRKGNTVIVESTIPPRTTRDVVAPIIEMSGLTAGDDVFLAHCPERVLPGKILTELYENNRIVGGINRFSASKVADVYRTFVMGKVMETSAENAETAKLMENTYRNVNIALANELSKLSEGLKINPLEVISLANEHPRVNIHQPGPGVGGHCIPVDPYFIMEKDPANTPLITEAMAVNESMPGFVVEQVKKMVSIENGKVAVFGLAYKGETDDIRKSPALKVVEQLQNEAYKVSVYDPYVREAQICYELSSFEDTLEDADMLLILTDHQKFKNLNWSQVNRLMKTAVVLDTKDCVENDTGSADYYSFRNLYELSDYQSSVKLGK